MKNIWNGYISFGIASIPIGLTVAQSRNNPGFRTLHRECGTPIKQQRFCPFHERTLEQDELVKGYEFSKGQFVIVEDSDLVAIEPESGKTIAVDSFVPMEEIEPIYFDRTYYLIPGKEAENKAIYRLFHDALQQTEMAGVGKFILWGKENLCIIRPYNGEVLALTTMFYADDLRDPHPIEEGMADVVAPKKELAVAVQLVKALAGDFDIDAYMNEHRGRVRELLEAKMEGKPIKPAAAAPEKTVKSADLLSTLKKSVDAAEKAKKPKARKTAAKPRKKAAAK